jgi:hypothetical protein
LAQREWQTTQLTNQYAATKQKGLEFNHYKNTQKREWVAEKREIDSLLGNIQTKLKTYNLKPYFPPDGYTLQVSQKRKKKETRFHSFVNITFFYYSFVGFGQHLG